DVSSIAEACKALINDAETTKYVVAESVLNYPEAAADVATINSELSELQKVLELLNVNITTPNGEIIPETLWAHVMSIITNCSGVISQIHQLLDSRPDDNDLTKSAASWRREATALRMSLGTHRVYLNLALQFVSLGMTKTIQEDTNVIRGDVMGVKQDTTLITGILEELGRLRAIVANSTTTTITRDQDFILERYLDGLTSYAESVCADVVWETPNYSPQTPRALQLESLTIFADRIWDDVALKHLKDIPQSSVDQDAETERQSPPVMTVEESEFPQEEHQDNQLIIPRQSTFLSLLDKLAKYANIIWDDIKNPQQRNARLRSPGVEAEGNSQQSSLDVTDSTFRSSSDGTEVLFGENSMDPTLAPARFFIYRRKIAYQPEQRVKLVIVGDVCGKTALLIYQAMDKNVFVENLGLTVFEKYEMNVALDGRNVKLDLWDNSGTPDYSRLRAISYPESDIFLICFSIGSANSADNVLESWDEEVHQFSGDLPILLVGLQKDLRDENPTPEDLVTWEEGDAIRSKIGANAYLECSAKTGEGVVEVLHEATRLALLAPFAGRRLKQKQHFKRFFRKSIG
ncbi:P-loop containing nucleoside triphosphate hydrolase protein, partial [Penicillium angulare]